jgi:hypothetical protein
MCGHGRRTVEGRPHRSHGGVGAGGDRGAARRPAGGRGGLCGDSLAAAGELLPLGLCANRVTPSWFMDTFGGRGRYLQLCCILKDYDPCPVHICHVSSLIHSRCAPRPGHFGTGHRAARADGDGASDSLPMMCRVVIVYPWPLSAPPDRPPVGHRRGPSPSFNHSGPKTSVKPTFS